MSAGELYDLASQVHGLLTALEKSQAALRNARDELEVRVQERTHDLEAANEALRTSEERYRALIDNMPDAVFALDTEGKFTFASPRTEALTGHTVDELLGMDYRQVVAPESIPAVERQFEEAAEGDVQKRYEVTIVKADGWGVPVELGASSIKDDTIAPAAVQWIARDVTERKRFEDQLVHMASHDHLTGLFNRRRFHEELERELSDVKRHGHTGALLWIDLDQFKEINDSFGHRAGDELLIRLAQALKSSLREAHILARLGGDEFGVLLQHTDREGAETAAARLLGEIRGEGFQVGMHWVMVTASMGIACYPEHGTDADELLARADMAMYRSKDEGRDRFSVYDPTSDSLADGHDKLAWASRIREALENDRFIVYAQPIVDPRNQEIQRYELLVRMKCDGEELILPGAFLAVAESLGLVHHIDRWMLRQAIQLIAKERDAGRTLKLDVNLSGKAFGDPDLHDIIKAELEETGIDPALLGMEITETAAVEDMAKARAFIESFKALGCRFYLDDFGSGFSSFYYLKHLPVDCLKIDGSLIKDLTRSPQDRHLVKAIVELARGLGVQTTAEYVEDEETLKLLNEYGVDWVQGFHISRPGPATDMI
jgi:diguanylate cyclase (GGDEF)-like protein/PAS domain S-box-containing protein